MTPELVQVIFSPPVLVTFMVTVALAALVIWLTSAVHRRQRDALLAQVRRQQDVTVEHLLEATSHEKDRLIAEYERQARERDERIATLEATVSRLRDRMSASGVLGIFGGKQRDVVGALLLENEQLHELLVQKQQQVREIVSDMNERILAQMDEQTEAGARAVRYKQALLSAFLQHEEARQMLDRMIADGRVVALPQARSNNDEPADAERAEA
jgi:hypothetical protein